MNNISPQISVVLDKRHKKKTDTYPVKLRVYYNAKDKRYPTGKDLTKKEYDNIFKLNLNVRGENREIATYLFMIKDKAENIVKMLPVFTFEAFEKKMFQGKDEVTTLKYHYENKIDKLIRNEQIKTASSYQMSLNSLLSFYEYYTGSKTGNIFLRDITPEFLQQYEKYMVNVMERKITTVGIYLRPLRAIMNMAIEENGLQKERYPFGKNKYEIPAVRKVKKVLNNEQLKKLFEAEPETLEQEKAKDFWFFSYVCNGMNIKDIALLKNENLDNNTLSFYRAKTKNTSKTKLKPVIVYLTDFSKNVIEKYRDEGKRPKDYVFPILSLEDNAIERNNKIQNFVRFINQHVKKLARNNDLPEDISTYWARHSFATNAIRKGASIEFVSEALNHSNIKTTQNYFGGFGDSDKKKIAESLLNFG